MIENIIQMCSYTPMFFKNVPAIASNEDIRIFLGVKEVANASSEAVYVIDFHKRDFCFVSERNFFLCGHSVEEVLALGYAFYPTVIHCEDIPLLQDMHAAILRRLCNINGKDEINYFSFAIRIKNASTYLMAYHKIKPVFVDGQIRFGICMLSSSALKTPGHLRACYHNGVDYDEYSPGENKWIRKKVEQLDHREKMILKLYLQGETNQFIANHLKISLYTVRNSQQAIYHKLDVHNMNQAANYAMFHHLIYEYEKSDRQKTEEQPQVKKTRRPMTPEKRAKIQERLNRGESVNSIALRENISEGAIRYDLKAKRLTKSDGGGKFC